MRMVFSGYLDQDGSSSNVKMVNVIPNYIECGGANVRSTTFSLLRGIHSLDWFKERESLT